MSINQHWITVGLWCCVLVLGTSVATASDTGRWGVHVQIYSEPHEDGNPVYVNVLSQAIDLGYSFYPAERLSMTVGGELGFSTFYLDSEITFRPHFGTGVYLYF